jgi:Glycosyl transferase family 64 domain
VALDAAFVKWTRNPHRMVGFDARSHVITKNNSSHAVDSGDQNSNTSNTNNEVWAYGYLSTTQNMNRYSSSLTRFAFLHVDYLYSYMTDMPAQIRQVVAQNLNCEDIAMSFWISRQASLFASSLYSSPSSSSSLSSVSLPSTPPPQPPLLADLWVIQSQVKLATGEKSISAGKDHKKMRDACVNDFADWLQLKGQLKLTEWVHYEHTAAAAATIKVNNKAKKSVFECGAAMDSSIAAAAEEHVRASATAQAVKERIDLWRNDMQVMLQDLKQLTVYTRRAAKNQLLASNIQTNTKK